MKQPETLYRVPESLMTLFQREVHKTYENPIVVPEPNSLFIDFNHRAATLTNQRLEGVDVVAREMRLDPNTETTGFILSPNGSQTARMDEFVQSGRKLVRTDRFYSSIIVYSPDDPRSHQEKMWSLHDTGRPQPYSVEENGRGRIPLITEHPGQWDGQVIFDWATFGDTHTPDLSHVFRLLLNYKMNAPILGINYRKNYYPLHLVPEFTGMAHQPEYYAMDDQRLRSAYRLTSYAQRIHNTEGIRVGIRSFTEALRNAKNLPEESRPGFRKGMRKWIKDSETDLANAEYIKQVRNKRGLN